MNNEYSKYLVSMYIVAGSVENNFFSQFTYTPPNQGALLNLKALFSKYACFSLF